MLPETKGRHPCTLLIIWRARQNESGHWTEACSSMPSHYGSPDVGRLIGLANRILDRTGTRTFLRVVNG